MPDDRQEEVDKPVDPGPPEEPKKRNKAQEIRDYAEKGMTIQQIMALTGCHYQHVYNTLKYSKELKNPYEALKATKAKIGSLVEPVRSPPREERESVREKLDKVREHMESGKLERLGEELINADFDAKTLHQMLQDNRRARVEKAQELLEKLRKEEGCK